MKAKWVFLVVLFICFSIPKVSIAEGKNFLDSFFLIRSIDFLEPTIDKNELKGAGAVVIMPTTKDIGDINLGENFFVITPSSKILKGTVIKILDICGHTDELNCALLRLDGEIEFSSASDSLLGIRGKHISANAIGYLKKQPKNYAKKYFENIRKHLPANEEFYIDEVTSISLPNSKITYDFISIFHHDIKEFKTAGDKADRWTSFIFTDGKKESKLLTKIEKLSSIIAITDLNGDGLYEVLITYNNSAYEVSYEIRLFDRKRISGTKRVLYYWMD